MPGRLHDQLYRTASAALSSARVAGAGRYPTTRLPVVKYLPTMHVGTTRNGRPPHPLAVARKKHDPPLSLRDLAEAVEMSHVGLSHIETKRCDPHDKTRRKLEKVLGPIDWPELNTNGHKR